MQVRDLLPVTLDGFPGQFSFPVLREEILRNSAKLFGSGTSGRPAFSSWYLFCSAIRRSASAFSAAPFVGKPDSIIWRRFSRVEPGASMVKHQTVLPLRSLRL